MSFVKQFARPEGFEKWDDVTKAMWDITIVPFCWLMDVMAELKKNEKEN